uniref:hypothetical protein n=1 Tax=Alteromonas macleodii TaxID=28108 RepID=UPI003008D5A7
TATRAISADNITLIASSETFTSDSGTAANLGFKLFDFFGRFFTLLFYLALTVSSAAKALQAIGTPLFDLLGK